MTLDQLVLGLSDELDLPELQLNASGACQLLTEDGVAITIEDAPQENAAHLYATVGRMPEVGREALMATLLEAQLFNRELGEGCAFGYDPESDEIILCRRLSLGRIELDEFSTAVSELINWAGHWTEKIADGGASVTTNPGNEMQHFIRA